MKCFARFFLALFLLQTLLATPVQAGFAASSVSNHPPAPIQRAQAAIDSVAISNFTGSLTNIASDAAVGGTFTYDPQSIAQTVTYSGVDAASNPITQTSTGLSLARLVTGPGHGSITLAGPATGTIVSDSLTINGGDLSLGSGVDVSAGNQAILNAKNQTLNPGAAAAANAGSAVGASVGAIAGVTASPGASPTASLQGTTGQATTGPDSANVGQGSDQSSQTRAAYLQPLRMLAADLCAALVDASSGMILGQIGSGVDLEVAAAGNTEVVRAKIKTMRELGLNDVIEDILITLGKQ